MRRKRDGTRWFMDESYQRQAEIVREKIEDRRSPADGQLALFEEVQR